MSNAKPKHDFHLVDPSALTIFSVISIFILAVGALFYMHEKPLGGMMLSAGFVLVLSNMFFWWKKVISEGYEGENKHTNIVQAGLRLGMALFILSEIMFFFAFFFSFFSASLMPVDIITDLWPSADGVWPPKGIETLDPWDIPLLNTAILLLSGTTLTWAHHSLLHNDREGVIKGLTLTVILGLIFTGFQIYEYSIATFPFSGGGVYSSNFYMATGFHGFHVIVGTIFLAVCLFRAKKGNLTVKGHLGLEFAAWYWHFVDVVWLFLFVSVYWWGG